MEENDNGDAERKQQEESDQETCVEEDLENGAGGDDEISVVDSPPGQDHPSTRHRDARSVDSTRDEDHGFAHSGNDTTDSEEEAGGEDEKATSTTTTSDGATKIEQEAPTLVTAIAPAVEAAGAIRPKPKIRIKLKLPLQVKRKLPLSASSTAAPSAGQGPSADEESNFSRPEKTLKKSLPLSKLVTGTGSRRRPVAPSKQVKIPPLPSPGLLVPGKPTPSEVFDSAMAGAGYTVQQRTENPHRGSSVQRTVDDMFDTDVKLALHPIELVPREIRQGVVERDGEPVKLIDLLSRQFLKAERDVIKTAPSFIDMVPISLTLQYPKQYVDKRLAYVQKVREREKLIVEHQEACEDIEMSTEEGAEKKPNPIKIPPIPDLPGPISVEDLGLDRTDFSSNGEHAVFLPARADLVSHLDPKCFHVTGRYFGLTSNNIADPNICGPNAAGYSGTSGLATATTSTTTSTSGLSGGGMTLILSAGFHCAAAVPLKETSSAKPQALLAPPAAPSETVNALRLLMMDDGWADKFRVAIVKAAAYASRTQVYDTSFKGPNNLVYPDLGKAFSMYAQVKPCSRCKSNKQGVYHCRIRRRHKEADFDGGSTACVLEPYEIASLESLLVV